MRYVQCIVKLPPYRLSVVDLRVSRVEAWLLCKPGSADVHTSLAKISVVHISMVCIQAWFALKPDAESGLFPYKPGFYPRLYGNYLDPLMAGRFDTCTWLAPVMSRAPVTLLQVTVCSNLEVLQVFQS